MEDVQPEFWAPKEVLDQLVAAKRVCYILGETDPGRLGTGPMATAHDIACIRSADMGTLPVLVRDAADWFTGERERSSRELALAGVMRIYRAPPGGARAKPPTEGYLLHGLTASAHILVSTSLVAHSAVDPLLDLVENLVTWLHGRPNRPEQRIPLLMLRQYVAAEDLSGDHRARVRRMLESASMIGVHDKQSYDLLATQFHEMAEPVPALYLLDTDVHAALLCQYWLVAAILAEREMVYRRLVSEQVEARLQSSDLRAEHANMLTALANYRTEIADLQRRISKSDSTQVWISLLERWIARSKEPLARLDDEVILIANPNPVLDGPGAGTTTITWVAPDGCGSEVWVSVDGRAEEKFSEGAQGSGPAAWIQSGRTYTFRLYAGSGRTSPPLATVVVTREQRY